MKRLRVIGVVLVLFLLGIGAAIYLPVAQAKYLCSQIDTAMDEEQVQTVMRNYTSKVYYNPSDHLDPRNSRVAGSFFGLVPWPYQCAVKFHDGKIQQIETHWF